MSLSNEPALQVVTDSFGGDSAHLLPSQAEGGLVGNDLGCTTSGVSKFAVFFGDFVKRGRLVGWKGSRKMLFTRE